MWSTRAIADFTERYRSNLAYDTEQAFCFITCHRVEYFSVNPVGNVFVHPLSVSPRLSEGFSESYARLLSVVVGLESEIVGEEAIFEQFKIQFSNTQKTHPLFRLLQRVHDDAKRIRNRFGFFAPTHAFFALNELQKTRPDQRATLFVVGGGMLGRYCAAHALDLYDRVVLVTRSPKKVRKHSLPSGIEVISLNALVSAHENLLTKYADVVIATAKLTPDYVARLRNDLFPLATHIFDLCALPTLDIEAAPTSYRTLHDVNLHNRVVSYNHSRRELIDEVSLCVGEYIQKFAEDGL